LLPPRRHREFLRRPATELQRALHDLEALGLSAQVGSRAQDIIGDVLGLKRADASDEFGVCHEPIVAHRALATC
jgi:hypothetical protein